MHKPSLITAEYGFILGFGLFHFLVPLVLPPNFITAVNPVYSLFFGLQLAALVTPGCIILATLSILFVYTKNRYIMGPLIFMYLGGTFFHILYFAGIIPPLLEVPDKSFLAVGIAIDTFTAILIYDFYRRFHSSHST